MKLTSASPRLMSKKLKSPQSTLRLSMMDCFLIRIFRKIQRVG
ncbi:unnamed protein product [Acanthoscelides obtectus]|uniref:Uncharacterized protein n=1 Tax=Acanthoscelides obtectus TaxID=200917 RepID=A0A9P0PZ99_ACAOB|nr:unnamed protein product [Acanthoscelides obtectus]CAK1647725.1 hypothetical protein AOBTE_LOCUS15368 [Acanthoscelides obtectus]